MTGLERVVQVPEGVTIEISEPMVTAKGEKGELKKEFYYVEVSLEKKDSTIIIKSEGTTKKEKAVVGSYEAHLKNMFKGVTQGFKYTLKVVYAHFPITLKQSGDIIEIHNFFGEKAPRKARVVGNVKVKLEKDQVVIDGIDKEEVGQTSGNLEAATRVKRRDSRVFQDGIYLVSTE